MCTTLNHLFGIATNLKMTPIYLLVIIHKDNQSILYKVDSVVIKHINMSFVLPYHILFNYQFNNLLYTKGLF
jgi:hypothetical protein